MPVIRNGKASRAAQGGSKSKPNKESMRGKGPAHTSVNLWGIAGRREIMETSRIWQLRIPRSRHPKE